MDGRAKDGNSRAGLIAKLLALFVVVCVAITTVTHHVWPGLTGVPEHHVDIGSLIQMDATMILLGLVAFWHSWRTIGPVKSGLFLFTSIIFSGAEETAWILSGRFGLVPPTYYFTYGGLWFFEIPVYTCLAWYVICYCGYVMVKQQLPRIRPAGVAALVAAFGTCCDLWLDPAVCNRHLVSTLPDMWIWLTPTGMRLFGIPILNFAGWFGVIFTIIYVFDKKLRPEDDLGTKRVGRYCLFLAIGWGLLYLALHGVGALQATTTVDLFPMSFGAPVDPSTAGTAAIAAVLGIVYIGFFLIASIVSVIIYRKGNVEMVLKLVPAIVFVWWLNGGISNASQLLMVYPGATLVWIMIVFSAYPTLLVTWAVISIRRSPGGNKAAATHAP